MRPSLALLATLAVAACSRAPQVDVAAEVEAVRARSHALAAFEAARNADSALTFWADDAVVQPVGAPRVQGKEALRGLYASFLANDQIRSFESIPLHIEVSQSGDMALDYGTNRMVLVGERGDLVDVAKYLAVWKKVNGIWLVAALSFNSDTPAPVPAPAAPGN